METGFGHFAAAAPGRLALLDLHGNRWSRGDLAQLVNRLSRGLRAGGMARGDVIAIMSNNCPQFLAAYLAATQIGLYVVPLNWHLAPLELGYVLADSKPRAIVVEDRLAKLTATALDDLSNAPELRISIGVAPGFIELEEFTRPFGGEPIADPEFGQVMYYTSATTGRPKGVHVPLPTTPPWEGRMRQLQSLGVECEGDHVHLCASVLYHRAPLDWAIVALHMGHAVVLARPADPERLLQLIETYRVTTSFMVPTTLLRLLKLPPEIRGRHAVGSLKCVIHAGAPCPVEPKRAMIAWWGPVFWDDYGCSELGNASFCGSQEWLAHPGTVGRAAPGVTLRIIDEQGNALPSGEIGLVYMGRDSARRFAYRNDEAKTRACYRGDLFTVGDVGYLDKDGYLFLCDRSIDTIVCGGTKIYSAEIEQVLVAHPQVMDCAVIGVPDALFGEVPIAIVQPAADVEPGPVLTREISRFLRGTLSIWKVPRRIEYRTELPRDPAGKLNKRRLREQLVQSSQVGGA